MLRRGMLTTIAHRRGAGNAAARAIVGYCGGSTTTTARSGSEGAVATSRSCFSSSSISLSSGRQNWSGTSFDLPDPRKFMTYAESMSYGHPVRSEAAARRTEVSSAAAAASTPDDPQAQPPRRSMSTLSWISSCEFEGSETHEQTAGTGATGGGIRSWSPQLTKIVATIGPTSEQLPVLQDLVRCGLRVMRLNFSHATVEEVELRVKNLRLCQGRHGARSSFSDPSSTTDSGVQPSTEQNVRAILLDTRGPEIRTGKLRNDHSGKETIHFEAGESITLHTNAQWSDEGSTETDLYIDYAGLHRCLTAGMKVLLDDGAITLTVTSVEHDKAEHGTVTCRIENSGELRSRAGVNLPGAETDLPAMSEKDKVDIRYGMTKDVDYVAASFVQNADNVREIRQYIVKVAQDLGWDPNAPLPLIISKIESVSALRHFDEILAESDGIMVARGDLGVEIPIQQVTNAQKEMVAACNAAGKPVIVATQMLESMAKNPRPTRAEVADVTNAVYDGADAVMLSGETAKGKYPVESLKMMNEIILGAERFVTTHHADRMVDVGYPGSGGGATTNSKYQAQSDPGSVEESIAKAAVTAAEERHAAAILVLTSHGTLPRLVAAYRPDVPVVTFCPNAKVARQLMLHRAVHPIVGLSGAAVPDRPGMAIRDAKAMGFVKAGDDVVVVTMESDGDDAESGFATMKMATVS